jgi:hypothetical protein
VDKLQEAGLAVPVQLVDKLQVTSGDLSNVSREVTALREGWSHAALPLGALAPNADLSKLVVWCFAAGFTQTLVPSMLAKISPKEKTT